MDTAVLASILAGKPCDGDRWSVNGNRRGEAIGYSLDPTNNLLSNCLALIYQQSEKSCN